MLLLWLSRGIVERVFSLKRKHDYSNGWNMFVIALFISDVGIKHVSCMAV